jgi:hypothetical protein
MRAALDQAWAQEVCAYCDPVFEAAKVGFVRQVQHADEIRQVVTALLWEAEPLRFAAKYPDSGIVETYGEGQWPDVHCIDYWVYIDHENRRCRLSVEGWNLPDLSIELDGHSGLDGPAIADTFARILGVASPRV